MNSFCRLCNTRGGSLCIATLNLSLLIFSDCGSGSSVTTVRGISGVYHSGAVTNLEISEVDGSFRWFHLGCDTIDEGNGSVERRGERLVLLPATGSARFRWPHTDIERLEASLDENGDLLVRTGDPDAAPEIWTAGGACGSPCEDPLVGFPEVHPCDNPSLGFQPGQDR